MLSVRMTIVAALAGLAVPLAAQQSSSPNADAVNAVEAPVTAGLNNNVANAAEQNRQAREISAGQQAQYQADMASYRAQVERNNIAVARDTRRYARQQQAYADAMLAWRYQVRDCQKGRKAACDAPPPDPSSFY